MRRRAGGGGWPLVHPDPIDERDRLFSELNEDIGEDEFTRRRLGRRLDKQSRAAWLEARKQVDELGELPGKKICDDYRELADATWHQRGQECTGFALAAIADYHLRRHWLATIEEQLDARLGEDCGARAPLTPRHWMQLPAAEQAKVTVSRRMMYEMAQEYDRRAWTVGSTTRGALKGWMSSGVADEREWPYAPGDEKGAEHGRLSLRRVIESVRRPGAQYYRIDKSSVAEMRLALAANHPLFVSAMMHSGWYEPYLPASDRRGPAPAPFDCDNETTIRRLDDMKLLNGHAFVIVGYNVDGWYVHNSWGPEWGDGGYAVLPYEDWAMHGADVWFVLPPPVRRKHPVQEDRYLPESNVATVDGELARKELFLDDVQTRLAIERARAELGDGAAMTHDDLETAVGQTEEQVTAMRRDVEASPVRSALRSSMWRHVVTLGDDGRLLPPGNEYGLNKIGLFTLLWMFRRQTENWKRRRLAIVADGGYWSHDVTIELLQPLRDALMENEVYPIFLTWDTPWYADMVGWLYGNSDLHPPAEGDPPFDLESVAPHRRPYHSRPWQYANAAEFPAPRIWKQMNKRAVDACGLPDGAGSILSEAVAYNRTKASFEVHLIGHTVGDLLLPGLAALLPPVASCNLWAPVTSLARFGESYAPMVRSGHIGNLALRVLEQDLERQDHIGPVPGSFLRLVSDVLAVEDLDLDQVYDELSWKDPVWPLKPVPLLGLHVDLDASPEVAQLVEAGRATVDVIGHGRHLGLLRDDAVYSSTVEHILAGPPEPAEPIETPAPPHLPPPRPPVPVGWPRPLSRPAGLHGDEPIFVV